MDATFEILVPKDTRFTQLNFEIPYFEWGGVNYAQGLPECTFGKGFILKFQELYKVGKIDHALPDRLNKIEWQAIWVEGDGLDWFVGSLFDVATEEPGFSLHDLLTAILGDGTAWVVIYGPEWDGFGYWRYAKQADIIPALELSLKDTRQGFLFYHD